jgi:hypothetical protein
VNSTTEIPNSSFSSKRCIEISKHKSVCVDKQLYKLIWIFILNDMNLFYMAVNMPHTHLNYKYIQLTLIVRLKVFKLSEKNQIFAHMSLLVKIFYSYSQCPSWKTNILLCLWTCLGQSKINEFKYWKICK